MEKAKRGEGGTITLKFLGKGDGLNFAALCLLWSWVVELRLQGL